MTTKPINQAQRIILYMYKHMQNKLFETPSTTLKAKMLTEIEKVAKMSGESKYLDELQHDEQQEKNI